MIADPSYEPHSVDPPMGTVLVRDVSPFVPEERDWMSFALGVALCVIVSQSLLMCAVAFMLWWRT